MPPTCNERQFARILAVDEAIRRLNRHIQRPPRPYAAVSMSDPALKLASMTAPQRTRASRRIEQSIATRWSMIQGAAEGLSDQQEEFARRYAQSSARISWHAGPGPSGARTSM